MATTDSSGKQARPKNPRVNSVPPPRKTHAACDECRSRKLKCTSEKPSCARCRADGSVCHYSPQKQMGRPRKKRSEEETEMAEMAKAMSTIMDGPSPGRIPVTAASASPETAGSSSATASPLTTVEHSPRIWDELSDDVIRFQETIGAAVMETAAVVHVGDFAWATSYWNTVTAEQLCPSSIIPPESYPLTLRLLNPSPIRTPLPCNHTSTLLSILKSITPYFRSLAPLPRVTLPTCISLSRHALSTISDSVTCASCLTIPIPAYTSHILITVLFPLTTCFYLRTLTCIDEDFGTSGLIGEGRRRVKSAKSAVKAEFRELLECCDKFEKISRARHPGSWIEEDEDEDNDDGIEGLEEHERSICRRVLGSVRSVARKWRICEEDGPASGMPMLGAAAAGSHLTGVPIVMLEDVVKTDWREVDARAAHVMGMQMDVDPVAEVVGVARTGIGGSHAGTGTLDMLGMDSHPFQYP